MLGSFGILYIMAPQALTVVIYKVFYPDIAQSRVNGAPKLGFLISGVVNSPWQFLELIKGTWWLQKVYFSFICYFYFYFILFHFFFKEEV